VESRRGCLAWSQTKVGVEIGVEVRSRVEPLSSEERSHRDDTADPQLAMPSSRKIS
jgi:hypothetical protein